MKDSFGRDIKYLRISITDKCNHFCFYCRDKESLSKKTEITADEIVEYIGALAQLGIEKVRITGGEPLMRGDVVSICNRIKNISGIKELCLTTNGSLLGKYAVDLKKAGLDRLNISLNTLKREKFRKISQIDNFDAVENGIKAAQDVGFENIKLNVVLMKGVNDDEILDFVDFTKDNAFTIRFIEYMPIGAAIKNFHDYYLQSSEILRLCPKLKKINDDGVSQLYAIDGYKGRIGLIRPVSEKFCAKCNRIRITSDSMLRFCLHGDRYVSLKGLHKEKLINTIKESIFKKPYSHQFDKGLFSERAMNTIGG